MSDNDKSNEKTVRNESTSSGESDIRERLTLHVRKRLTGELQVVVKQEPMSNSNSRGSSPRKKSKKSKKKNKTQTSNGNSSRTPRNSTRVRVKDEVSPVEGVFFDRPATDTPEICSDEPGSRLQSPATEVDEAATQAARESFLNNAILNEILDQKKRELFESEEILQLIREKMKSTT
ncbi:hypothetical protein B566_EDAN004967 [Ephemera danica]|nr:hypothetical protein B566_EDAN004967 [Ephemera danica]